MVEGNVVQFLSRHLVPIRLSIKQNNIKSQKVVTTFVLSVYDMWFLVTAGHIMRDIENLIDDPKSELIGVELLDFFGLHPTSQTPIPFDYVKTYCNYWFDEDLGLGGLP